MDAEEVNWRFILIIGTSLYMIADVDASTDLSSGRFDANHCDELLERLLSFCNGGLLAPSSVIPDRTARLQLTHRPPKSALPKRTDSSGDKPRLRR